jgi:hypothetical protein
MVPVGEPKSPTLITTKSPRRRWSRSSSELNLLSSPLSPTTSRAAGSGRGKLGGWASARDLFSLASANDLSIGSLDSSKDGEDVVGVVLVGCFKTTPSGSPKKSVRFDSVSIREHSVILGSNPAVTCGAPIELGWNHVNETVLPVDVFDHIRQGQRRRRKHLLLPVDIRARWLLEAGHSLFEIADATMEAQMTKRKRYESAQVKNWERLEQAVEATGKTIRKIVNYKQRTDTARTA